MFVPFGTHVVDRNGKGVASAPSADWCCIPTGSRWWCSWCTRAC